MRQMTTEFEEELDFGIMNSGSGNLARKADIRQYAQRAGGSRTARNIYSSKARHDDGMYTQAAYRQEQNRPIAQGQERRPQPAARRNPYLVNMRQESGRGSSYDTGRPSAVRQRDVDMIWGDEIRHAGSRRPVQGNARSASCGPGQGNAHATSRGPVQGNVHAAVPGQARVASDSRARAAGQPAVNQRRRLLQEKRRREMMKKKIIMGVVEVMAVLCIAILVYQGFFKKEKSQENLPVTVPQENMGQSPIVNTPGDKIQGIDSDIFAKHPQWEENFLTPNEYSRPGDPLTQVNNIFVHYTANPNTSAKQNRSYFEQQKDTHERSVSAHFIIGYDGEIMQIVPLDEIAYAVMTRNEDSISIECCYKAENGQFTQETYDSLISLLSWLTEAYNLDAEDILRHYDCGGKKCPLYYTEHEDAWDKLIKDVKDYTL